VTRRARICTQCRRLNSADDTVCYHCRARLPGDGELQLRGVLSSLLGHEQPAARFYVVLCVGIYLACAMKGGFSLMGGVPMLEAARWGAIIPRLDEPWRVLSAMFVHFGALHILFNMLTLNDMGRLLEPRLGSGRFLCAFLITGIVGFLTSDQWYALRGSLTPTAGASGGLLGLIGVLIGMLYVRKDPAWKQVLARVFVYGLIFALVMPTNNAAHLGGLVSGGLLGLWFGRERRPTQNQRAYNVIAALLVVASLGSIVASQLSVANYERKAAQSGVGR
jgi:membrane associated rhomboid family serine protease